MADLDDEDVIFQNSPLEKYLKEAGFTVIESEKVDRPESQAEESNLNIAVKKIDSGLKDWILSFSKKYLFLDVNKWLSVRETYASIVINSGTLSEDDYTFLLQFDSDMFDIPEKKNDQERSQIFSLYNHWKPESMLSILFLLVAIFIASSNWEYLLYHQETSIGILLVFSILVYYVWKLQCLRALHYKNIQILKNYTDELKSFVTIFRKAIMLIQELELISKGYTLVGLGMQFGYQQKDAQGNCTRDIYPKLRQSLCDKGMNVLMTSCSRMENIFSIVPFAQEVTGVFTCISSDPLSQFGLKEYSQIEQLSLHYLKSLLSAIASQQSEFLSRFLLSLSYKARLSEISIDRKDFKNLLLGFYDQLAMVTEASKSLQLSYHLHKSALTFSGDHEVQNSSPNCRPQSKWTHYYTSVHSLELHLKACLTRMQFISTFITENESEELASSTSLEQPVRDKAKCIKALESKYKLLKNDLDGAVCCWEEGFHNLKIILGSDKFESLTTQEVINEKDKKDEDSNAVFPSCLKEPEEVIGDCVFEGYTDFEDDSEFYQESLTREELEKESRSREESQHLLVELKNVLLTKAKDPLITDKGFVRPNKRQDIKDESITETGDTEVLVHDFNVNENYKGYNIKSVSDSVNNGEGIKDYKEPSSILKRKETLPYPQWSNKVFSMSIQEAARSRGNALMEESYGSSDSE